MSETTPIIRMSEAADLVSLVGGRHIRLALPLGLGKANRLVNTIYERVKADPSRSLTIYTALSLTRPPLGKGLARRFMEPFRARHWGEDYPDLRYAQDALRDALPANVRVHEFYLQAASALHASSLQRDYQAINYTHVAASILRAEVQVVVQIVAKRGQGSAARYSLSCNPDLTRDVADLFQREKKPLCLIGVVHPDLPFLGGDAEVGADFFTAIVEDPANAHPLFAPPRLPVSPVEHAIGLHASRLIIDGGTLQVGIGSLSDAVVAALLLRHQESELYQDLCHNLWDGAPIPYGLASHETKFEQGLYGLSEMVMDGFMHLRRAGILRREVVDERNGKRAFLHGAFALGSKDFYAWLRQLSDADFQGIHMSRVSRINDIYDPQEGVLRVQRRDARFLNTCMQVTLLGGVASETLPDGRVVSGVGGQYNFVAMAHELRGARSVIMLRSTRHQQRRLRSNIVWSHEQLTIPRHLRDVVVTEYGVADLRGKTDEETIRALLAICDARFQDELAELAKRQGKLARDYQPPVWARGNTPERVTQFVEKGRQRGVFSPFPFGSDFTPVEEGIALALDDLKESLAAPKMLALARMVRHVLSACMMPTAPYTEALGRMGLQQVTGLRDWLDRCLLLAALARQRERGAAP